MPRFQQERRPTLRRAELTLPFDYAQGTPNPSLCKSEGTAPAKPGAT